MKYLTKKRLIVAVLTLVFIGLVGLIANDVLAEQPAPAAPNLRGFGTGKLTDVSTTVITIYGVLWALQGILNGLLTFTGFVLDNVFLWAVSLNPGTMPIVATGWGVIRDISNSIFILIVLWIAFTIIFNFENLGGRKLLVRVIIMALLINFSLAMVSLVFGFTNALARPFRNAIANTSSSEATGFRNVSDIIMSNTKIYATLNKGTQRDKDAINNYEAQQEAERTKNIPVDIGGGFQSYLGAPQDAKAAVPLIPLAGCVFGALTGIPIPGIGTVCAASALAVQWATSLISLGAAVGITALLYQSIIEMAVGSFFLILTIFALLTASIVLIARIVAMTFLSILAPAAFLLYAMPNKYGEKYWHMWVENVLKWAFFAPAFYFLFYISLLVLQEMSAKKPVLGSFIPDLPQQLILIVFLAFLFGTIGLARKMGITVADSFINWGKKAGWGALGFAGGFIGGMGKRITYPLAGRGAAALDKRIGKIENPFLRRALSIPSTGFRKIASVGREEVLSAQKKYAGMSTEEIQRALGQKAYITGADRTGMLLELTKRQAVAPRPGIKGYGTEQMRESVDQLKSVGADFMSILKASPSIAKLKDVLPEELIKVRNEELRKRGVAVTDEEALQRVIWSKIGPADIAKLDFKIFDNIAGENKVRTTDGREVERGDFMKEIFLQTARPEYLTQLGRASPATAAKIQEYLSTDSGKTIIPQMEVGTYNYFSSNIAGELGWRLPQEHRKPAYAQAEEELRSAFEQQKITVENASKEFSGATRSLEQFDREVKRLGDTQKDLETKSRLLGERLTALQREINILPPASVDERVRVQKEVDYTRNQKERIEGVDLKATRERLLILDARTKRVELEKKVDDTKQEVDKSQEKLNQFKQRLT